MPIYTPGKVVLAKDFTWNETVWNPSMISTALWLDAADASTVTTVSGAVSQWNDKSGNSRHLQQTDSVKRPSYSTTAINQKPALVFDGVNDLFEYNSQVIGLTGSIFSVASYGNTSLAAQTLIWSDASDATTPRYFVQLNSGTVRGYSGTYYNAGTYSANTPEILNIFVESGSSTIYRNGALAGSASAGVVTTNGLHIGGSSKFGVAASVRIAELIAVNEVVATSTRQRMEGYLAHKWGLTANLPADHPYKTVGPTP